MVFVILLLCVLQLSFGETITISEQRHCNSDDKYFYFGTKTSYHAVRGNLSAVPIPEKCTAVRFWSFNRHGTRLPKQEEINSMSKLAEFRDAILERANESQLCQNEIEELRRWEWKLPGNVEPQMLTKAGFEELKEIAQRYKEKYPQLLSKDYNPNYFYFQHTDKSRTKQSFLGYTEGLFGKNNIAGATESNKKINDVKTCNGWRAKIDQLDTWRHFNDFKKTPEFQNIIVDISAFLGFQEILNETVILDAYNLCRFEKAWNFNDTSPWCNLFSVEQRKILEYLDDLSYYYFGGYGIKFNPEIGCPPVKDLYERFEKAIEGSEQEPKVTVYFSHSVPTVLAYTALGVFRDKQPLTSSNFDEQSNRKFHLSFIDSFATNNVAVLYQCESEDRFMVQFLNNEKPLEFGGCTNGLCSWSKVKDLLREISESCDLMICNLRRTKSSGAYKQKTNFFYSLYFVFLLRVLY